MRQQSVGMPVFVGFEALDPNRLCWSCACLRFHSRGLRRQEQKNFSTGTIGKLDKLTPAVGIHRVFTGERQPAPWLAT